MLSTNVYFVLSDINKLVIFGSVFVFMNGSTQSNVELLLFNKTSEKKHADKPSKEPISSILYFLLFIYL